MTPDLKEIKKMNTTEMQNQAKVYIEQLSPDNLKFVSDFLAYLISKENSQKNLNNDHDIDSNISALELAGDLVGSLEAPADLSTNKDYLKGFGE